MSTRQQRHGPPRTLDWEAVLDRWHLGQQVRPIAAALGINAASVRRIVHLSRARGDARAHRRRAPHGQAGTGVMIAGAWGPHWAHPLQPALPLPAEAPRP